MSEEQAAVEETTSDTLLDPSAPTLSEGEYFLSDGIKGTGDVPEWYIADKYKSCLLYTSPSPRDRTRSRMPSSA